jgi:uncharacterized protein YllA (UPF0747 family)
MPPADTEGTPMSNVALGELASQINALYTAAGSAPNGSILDIVRECYRAGATVGSAYVQLLRTVLEPLGIPVLDASHPAVQVSALPFLRDAVSRSDAVEAALDARARDLKREGHQVQVKLVKGRTLVFTDAGGKRDRIRSVEGDSTFDSNPQARFGPNVLLRPIMERSIIPTVAYMGGPGEIAYFAQVSAVSAALGVPTPLVVPRWSGFVVEPRIEKILERYSLSIEDFRDPHAVESRLARASLPQGLIDRLKAFRETIEKSVDDIAASEGADLVSKSVLDGLKGNVSHRVEKLERRFAASVKRRGNDALRDVQIARAALFPLGKPQERALNVVPLLARHGDDLFSAVLQEARAHAAKLA